MRALQIEELVLEGDAGQTYYIDLSGDKSLTRLLTTDKWKDEDFTLPKHKFARQLLPAFPSKREAVDGFEAWSIDGKRVLSSEEINYPLTKCVHVGHAPYVPSMTIQDLSELETIYIKYKNVPQHRINNPKLKELIFLKCTNAGTIFDLANNKSLRKIVIDSPSFKNLSLDLAGCENILSIFIDTGSHPVDIKNLHHCKKLRTLTIHSSNANDFANTGSLAQALSCEVSILQTAAAQESAYRPDAVRLFRAIVTLQKL